MGGIVMNTSLKYKILKWLFSVTTQRYEINILPESIMVGNDAIFKCSIPSFVTDFVFVESWIDSEANDLGKNLSGTFQHVSVILNSVKDCLLISKISSCSPRVWDGCVQSECNSVQWHPAEVCVPLARVWPAECAVLGRLRGKHLHCDQQLW